MENRFVKFIVLAVIGFALGGLVAYLELQREPEAVEKPVAQVEAKSDAPQKIAQASKLTGEFHLTDENGNAVSHTDYLGKPKLVFFGFTHCPDVCPTTLTKLTSVLEDVDLPVLFITVDPARDTVEIMKEYTDMFDPRIIGLTGTQEQIDAAINSFKVYAAKDPSTEMTNGADHSDMDDMQAMDHGEHEMDHNYLMQHSAYIYMLGADNELLDVINSNDSAEDITQQITVRL